MPIVDLFGETDRLAIRATAHRSVLLRLDAPDPSHTRRAWRKIDVR
jgi:hypothetical protein